MRGIHRSPVNSPHKGPVTQKVFPFDDVIMIATTTKTNPLYQRYSGIILLLNYGHVDMSMIPLRFCKQHVYQDNIRYHYWRRHEYLPCHMSPATPRVYFTCRDSLNQGLYSLSGKMPYRQISWSLEGSRLDVVMIVSLWNLTSVSAALLPRRLSNFKTIGKV